MLDLQTLSLLLRFVETRYDALCAYLVDDEGADRHDVRERADGLVEALASAERWAVVPAPLLGRVTETVRRGRQMWRDLGAGYDEVATYVGHRTPTELLDFVLAEIYRDGPAPAYRVTVFEPGDVDGDRCRRCGGPMLPGIAGEVVKLGSDDFGGDAGEPGTTLQDIGTGRPVRCLKCASCGHSVTPAMPTDDLERDADVAAEAVEDAVRITAGRPGRAA